MLKVKLFCAVGGVNADLQQYQKGKDYVCKNVKNIPQGFGCRNGTEKTDLGVFKIMMKNLGETSVLI